MNVSLWCPLAWTDTGMRHDVRLTLRGDVIARIECGVEAASADERLDSTLVMPGTANCHSHTFHRTMRGLGGSGGAFWSWRDTMYGIASRLTPETYRVYARAAFAEMLCAGYTAVGEFHYVHHQPDGTPYQPAHAMERALADAAEDVGIRLTLLDTLYLSSGFDAPVESAQRRFSDGTAARWAERIEALDSSLDGHSLVRVGAAIHSVRAVDPLSCAYVAEWARRRGRPLHVHVSEQPRENEDCLRHRGATPVRVLADAGVWEANATAVHATHLTDEDVGLLGSAGATVCLCPSTEADLGDGLARVGDLLEAGTGLSLGSDENILTDPFSEAQRVVAGEGLRTGVRQAIPVARLMGALTERGHASIGSPAGALAPGRPADLVALRLAGAHLAGVPLESIPLFLTAADIDRVWVAGREVVQDGRHVSVDPGRDLDEIGRELRRTR
ncbi:formimidoylglutamate deiminase [Schaalia naturae]|jgi:formiminoglutamate deiminase|uniref:Formimidoylglutamate deiminase n=1 Tax=Schaalia naturae TaxID=635203 RepID=A0ABW2SKD1_9ACTO